MMGAVMREGVRRHIRGVGGLVPLALVLLGTGCAPKEPLRLRSAASQDSARFAEWFAGWVIVLSDEEGETRMDTASVSRIGSSRYEATFFRVFVHTRELPDDPSLRPYKSLWTRSQHDCRSGEFRIVEMRALDSTGAELQARHDTTDWQGVIPQSAAEDYQRALCQFGGRRPVGKLRRER